MASTYENDLRLEEMATGENSGSWGTKTNTNLELVADAFSYGTETIADADTAITIADGAADAARSLALKINSSEDLTTTRVVTLGPNTTSKVWIIENNTSGGQVLTISAGSGSNITLANGTTKIIATDGIGAGSNVVELTQDIAIADLSVDGILSLADGTNSAPSLTNTGDTNTGLYFPAADEVGITVGGTQALKADSTGVDITGALGVDGDFDVNTDKFTVASATGNTAVAGTLGVTGITTATGGLNVDTISEITAAGGVTIDGVLLKDGGATLTGDLAVDTNILYVDTTNNRVGIQTSSPSTPLDVRAALSTVYTGTAQSAEHINIFNTATGAVGLTSGIRFQTRALDATGQAFFIGSTATSGGQAPNFKFQKQVGATTYQELAALNTGEAVFNDPGNNYDFRVESENDTNMFWVDANQDRVKIATASDYGAGVLNIDGAVYFANSSNKVIQGLTPTGWGYSPGAYGVIQIGGPNQGGTVSIGYDPSSNTSGAFTGDGGEMMFMGEMDFIVPNTTDTDFEYVMRLKQNEGAILNEKGWDNIDFRVESDNYNHMLFVDASTDTVTIGGSDVGTHAGMFNVAGNLGVITGSGNPTITIKTGGTGNNPGINYRAGDNIIFDNTLIASAATDYWRVGHGSSGSVTSEVLAVTTGNRVGINDTTPSYTVDVRQNTDGADDGVNLQPNNQTQNMRYSFLGTTSTYFTEFMVDSTDSGTAGYRYFKFYEGTRDNNGELLYLGYNGTVFNDVGADRDFRVESDSETHALFVDAADSFVGINSSDTQYGHVTIVPGGTVNSSIVQSPNTTWGLLALRRTVVTSALNNTTVDVFRFLKRDGSTVMATSHSSGSLYICVRGGSGANQGNYHYSLQHNGIGATGAAFTLVSSSSRGTNPVSSISVQPDGATGGIKVQITYINNSGVVNSGQCRVLYDGIISPT